ncbi:MAG: outer membrane chaperone Skp [Cytophaga sp.]|nr:outer membrane chaperone Skp [Cytophaga sp.]
MTSNSIHKSMRILFAITLIICSLGANAQEQKIGYAEWDYIFSLMPEYKKIDSDMKAHGAQLEAQMKAKYQDYESKLTAYQNLPATTPDAIRADKERELQGLQEAIQKFQQDAETSVRTKQTSLMEPVYTKVGNAIEAVAKENGYTYIINPQMVGGGDILLYSDEKYNISDLVLKKLGITPPAK